MSKLKTTDGCTVQDIMDFSGSTRESAIMFIKCQRSVARLKIELLPECLRFLKEESDDYSADYKAGSLSDGFMLETAQEMALDMAEMFTAWDEEEWEEKRRRGLAAYA